jgi:transcriptional regulator with XRE-family HTH domain
MDLRDVFATNLRRLRNARGLSQDDLAYEAGVSRSYLSQLEKGAFYASLKIIGRLAKGIERRAGRVSDTAGQKGARAKVSSPAFASALARQDRAPPSQEYSFEPKLTTKCGFASPRASTN